MSDDEIRYIEPREFREEGFLQEVNRLFFHPRGLALECDPSKAADEYAMRVWDYRDDPEGIVFAGEPPDPDKAQRVGAELERHAPHREELWGWHIQPLDVAVDPDGPRRVAPREKR